MPSKISIISDFVTSFDASSLSIIKTTTATRSIKILIPSSKLLGVVFKQVKQVNLEASSGTFPNQLTTLGIEYLQCSRFQRREEWLLLSFYIM